MTECAFPGCENKEYLPFKCKYCEKSFCRTHRLPENHNCEYIHLGKLPSRQPASEKPAAEATTEKPPKPKKSSKPKLKKPRQKKERKSRRQRREEKPIRAEYYEPTDDHYYATDGSGRVFTKKYSEKKFRDQRFLSMLGDSFTVGKEIFNLLIAIAVVSISWSLISIWMSGFVHWYFAGFMVIIVSLGYISLIIPKKLLAKRYGYTSRYLLSKIGLILTIITIVSPLRVLNPGSLAIPEMAYMNKKHKGLLSSIGLAINVVFGTTYLFLGLFLVTPSNPEIGLLMLNGAFFTSQILIFRLLPFRFSNGRKIFEWHLAPYLILLVFTLGIFITCILFGVISGLFNIP